MKTLQEIQNEKIEEFSMFDDWLDKYAYLIDLGNALEPFPDSLKTDDRLIKGCQSRVWLDARMKDGRLIFSADSDALITKGIISLLVSVYSGRTPEEISGVVRGEARTEGEPFPDEGERTRVDDRHHTRNC